MLPDAPHILLLMAIKETALAVDFLEDAGVAETVTIRHARNRKPVRSEKPCISILLVSDDPRPDELQRNMWETTRELVFDLQGDMDLETEDSDADPTGLGKLSKMLAAASRAIRDEASPLGQLCDYVTAGTVAPDEKSQADEGRLVKGMSVLYRVRSDDENVLLARGVTG